MLRISTPGFLVALLVAGCSGGQEARRSYDPQTGQTTYETQSYTVSTLSGSSIGSSKPISMRAVSRCLGRNCTPSTVELVFSASENQRLQLSGLGGEIVGDDTRIAWSSADAARGSNIASDQVVNVIGKFAAVDLSVAQLDQIANASSVRGSIGGQSLDLGTGVQAGLRSLLQKIEGRSSGSEGTGMR
jgi:PBP1b-binding outer membrane lipoprotein LpoB